MKLSYTRAMIKAALVGQLDNMDYKKHTIFGFDMPTSCPDVPDKILSPKQCWNDDQAFYASANKLAGAFIDNFSKFEEFDKRGNFGWSTQAKSRICLSLTIVLIQKSRFV